MTKFKSLQDVLDMVNLVQSITGVALTLGSEIKDLFQKAFANSPKGLTSDQILKIVAEYNAQEDIEDSKFK
jgi:hypothetical protein